MKPILYFTFFLLSASMAAAQFVPGNYVGKDYYLIIHSKEKDVINFTLERLTLPQESTTNAHISGKAILFEEDLPDIKSYAYFQNKYNDKNIVEHFIYEDRCKIIFVWDKNGNIKFGKNACFDDTTETFSKTNKINGLYETNQKFKQFWTEFQSAINAKDINKLATMIEFPLDAGYGAPVTKQQFLATPKLNTDGYYDNFSHKTLLDDANIFNKILFCDFSVDQEGNYSVKTNHDRWVDSIGLTEEGKIDVLGGTGGSTIEYYFHLKNGVFKLYFMSVAG